VTVELAAIPVAALAGMLGVLSPCVWPLVPVVTTAAIGEGGTRAALWLALGLAVSFAFAGTLISFVLVESGLDPELFRSLSGAVLILVAAALLVEKIAATLATLGSRLTNRVDGVGGSARSVGGALGVGALLGLVWLPCVGPTLGAAIALASLGRDLPLAFATMTAYGFGTGAVLLAAALSSRHALQRWRPGLASSSAWAKKVLGLALGILGALVLTGLDKQLEAWSFGWLPDWSIAL